MSRQESRWALRFLDCVAAAAAVLVVSMLARAAGLNVPTVALVLHTTVVILAAMRNLAAGITAALAATATFSFFLHPAGSWRISEPANWLALVSFLVASTVVGRLLILARDEALEAEEQRKRVTTLYRLGADLLAASEGSAATDNALALALAAVSGASGGLVRKVGGVVEIATWKGAPPDERLLEACAPSLADGTARSRSIGGQQLVVTPIDTDEALVLMARETDSAVLDSVSALVALALRHQRAVTRAARTDALRESELVRTSLIRAVSHDLNTPLTAMMLELDALERELADPASSRARLASLKEDTATLRHRIESLLAMARIDAGTYRPRLEPVAAAELLRSAVRHLAIAAEARPVSIEVEDECPDPLVDLTLATEIMTNLVDNAHRAAPPGETIRLVARRGAPGRVLVEIADSGPGLVLDDPRWSRGVPIPVDDLPRRGLGLELARTFARANRGTVTIRRQSGTIASIDLAAAGGAADNET